jgi:hypothetical protein
MATSLSDNEDVKGTDPVRSTMSNPRVKNAIPSDLAK